MKTLSAFGLSATFLLVLAACGDPAANVTAANTGKAKEVTKETGTELKFSNEGSKIDFRSNKTVKGGHDGGFNKFTGKMIVDGDTVKQVEADIDMSGIWTDDDTSDTPKLTNHLKTDDFFDVANHPTAKFITTEIKAGGEGGTHTVTGNFTLRGVTNSISSPATIAASGKQFTAKAEFKIDRMKWGVKYAGAKDNLIRDEVILKLDINAG